MERETLPTGLDLGRKTDYVRRARAGVADWGRGKARGIAASEDFFAVAGKFFGGPGEDAF